MGAGSAIEWTDHTFNPWWGCEKVSAGCAHCYAETFAHRLGHNIWGKDAGRRVFGEHHWNEPLRWDRAAAKAGVQAKVFCASMADVFEDHPVAAAERPKLFRLIEQTPHLIWQLLTKRPENMNRFAPAGWTNGGWPRNVWALTTVEDQAAADRRIHHLLMVPARIRGLSCEPLLGPLPELFKHILTMDDCRHGYAAMCRRVGDEKAARIWESDGGIHWVIAGGESGAGARPTHPDWVRSIRDQCQAAGVAFFFKQWGEWVDFQQYDSIDPTGDSLYHWDGDRAGQPKYRSVPLGHDGAIGRDADSVLAPHACVYRVGKKIAGRLLDGREHNEFPEAK